jgi:hypothetical protein
MADQPYLRPPLPHIQTLPDGFVLESYDINTDALHRVTCATADEMLVGLDDAYAKLRESIGRWAALDHEERLARITPIFA